MKVVIRRLPQMTAGLLCLAACAMAGVPGLSLRGKLVRLDDRPALETGDRKPVYLEGDEATVGVLNDKRIWGTDFEAVGHFNSPGHFEIDPIHTHAMFVHKDGKRLAISYWCEVCYIRTYTPGTCVCCQKYTDLELKDPDEP
ncbi:MAG TPA: hypothetical protein VIX89_19305 [Bryobacteraceae bacterium]